ncbi:MAG: hypothetical protein IJL66_06305 [Lachnospiraceae bacterium]|nr:hypothetical protein [Lachnospiraceae bacterium]
MRLSECIYKWGYLEDGTPKSVLILNENTPGPTTIAALAKWYMEAVDPQKAPHKHLCDETVCFVGSDWEHPEKLNGKARVYINGERFDNDRSFMIYAPKNVIHCPFIFDEIEKPLIHPAVPIMIKANTERFPEDLEGYDYNGNGQHHYAGNFITSFAWKDYVPLDGEKPVLCVDDTVLPGAFWQKIVWYTKALDQSIVEPHTAEHDEMLMFIGSDPEKVDELNAAVTVRVNGETETLTKSFFLFVPKGSAVESVTIDSMERPFIFSYAIDTQDNKPL